MFFTLDELIAELERMRQLYGSNCQVAIDDADTRWTLPIETVSFDPKEMRVLIGGDYNSEEFPPRAELGKGAAP
jgi:hypothetical protein